MLFLKTSKYKRSVYFKIKGNFCSLDRKPNIFLSKNKKVKNSEDNKKKKEKEKKEKKKEGLQIHILNWKYVH